MTIEKYAVQVMLALGLLSLIGTGSAQTVRLDNGKFVSIEEPVVASLRCQGMDVQFAKGMRWTPADFSAEISVLGPRGLVTTLGPSCHKEMSCVSLNGQPSVLIVVAPACGGNAVPEDYVVIQLRNMEKKVFSYTQAKKLRLIRY